ncbi:hypothetical protein C2R22_10800 [Salinigranum rubrum]|uniref:Conserved hypothetical protein CHP02391 domain-containing protein n=1 Tax=Salinigranum rubrum TaxID=755307 RepID=A0A2I8VJG0_9EURY|nr:TIGR02391 family protein [Salinigranum rubrum]AUV82077.1 hypothetical protein C2R22_10800 [Salinigranum rubrum]
MITLIVSDKLSEKFDSDPIEYSGGDIFVRGWEFLLENDPACDVLVLDLDLESRVDSRRFGREFATKVGHGEINNHSVEFIECFDSLCEDIPTLLRSGSVVITLHSNGVIARDRSRHGPDSSSVGSSTNWLNGLDVADSITSSKEGNFELVSEISAVRDYYAWVGRGISVELNTDVVTEPTILAEVSGEIGGVAVREFRDWHGERVDATGSLVILPQPRSLARPFSLAKSLAGIGQAFHLGSDHQNTRVVQSELPIDSLDDELQARCADKFDRGEYADAVRAAGQLLEERLKQYSPDEVGDRDGYDLISHLFSEDGGPLSFGRTGSERKGIYFMYAGAYLALRNPLSHRSPDGEDDEYLGTISPEEAHHAICYVDLLLKFLDKYN